MKTITSKEKLKIKLKKNNLLHSMGKFYLSDFHRTSVGRVLSEKMIMSGELEKTRALGRWFEDEYRLTKSKNHEKDNRVPDM